MTQHGFIGAIFVHFCREMCQESTSYKTGIDEIFFIIVKFVSNIAGLGNLNRYPVLDVLSAACVTVYCEIANCFPRKCDQSNLISAEMDIFRKGYNARPKTQHCERQRQR